MNLLRALRRLSGACLISVALSGAVASAASTRERPARIVSLNMCADELVLRLADPQRIASVTWLSQDPRNATMAEAARRVPANHGLAEEVLGFRPDLVVAGAYTTRATVSLLGRVGIAVHEFGVPRNLAEMKAQITEMAELLGEPARGEALLAGIEQRLQALAARRVERPLRAIVLRPSGFTVGRGPLVDEILTMERLKTAVYSFETPLQAGAVLAGASEATVATLGEFGREIGIAYQIVDDVLGVFGEEESTGKTTIGDLREGKRTVMIAFACSTPEWARLQQLIGDPDLTHEQAIEARLLLVQCGAKAFAEDLARGYAQRFVASAPPALYRADIAKWKKVIQAQSIKAD